MSITLPGIPQARGSHVEADRHCRPAAPIRCAHARRRRRPLAVRRGSRPPRRHPGAVPARRAGQRRPARCTGGCSMPRASTRLLFDQRGAGRSHPYLSLAANTTQHLVADIEAIREHFGIERWLVVGGSWGSTLASPMPRRYPRARHRAGAARDLSRHARRRSNGPSSRGRSCSARISLPTSSGLLPEAERADPLAAYLRRLADPDPAVQAPAAQTWSAYERALSELAPAQTRLSASVRQRGERLPPTPIIEAHYIRNDFFLEPGQLLRDAQPAEGHSRRHRAGALRPPVPAEDRLRAEPSVGQLPAGDHRQGRPRHHRAGRHGGSGSGRERAWPGDDAG